MAPRHTRLAIDTQGDLLLSVSVAGTDDGGVLNDSDIGRLMDALRADPTRAYMAGFIGSASSTAVQRKEGADLIRSRNIPVAVITDDRIVRGFVTAVSWIGANVKAFSWDKARNAPEFLMIDHDRTEAVVQALTRLRDQLLEGESV